MSNLHGNRRFWLMQISAAQPQSVGTTLVLLTLATVTCLCDRSSQDTLRAGTLKRTSLSASVHPGLGTDGQEG